jgi:RNA polymerase sigma-70 factor (ECF subfamily)
MDREQPLVAVAGNESSMDLIAQIRDAELTPAAAATWHELQARFQQACEQLDDLDQEIVLLRHFEQLSNSEAAEALQVSPQAASMRYLRAMRRLREFMDGTHSEDSADKT